MEILGFDLSDPKFKYEDKVWCYFDPRYLEDHVELPVFECEVWGCKVTAESAHGNKPKLAIVYEVTILESFDEPSWVGEEKLFVSKADAARFALSELRERAESVVAKGERYTAMVDGLASSAEEPPCNE